MSIKQAGNIISKEIIKMAGGLETSVKPSWKLKIEDFYPLLWGIGHYADRNIHLTRQTEHNKYATRLISLVTFNVIMLVGGVVLSDYIIDSNNLIKKEQTMDYRDSLGIPRP